MWPRSTQVIVLFTTSGQSRFPPPRVWPGRSPRTTTLADDRSIALVSESTGLIARSGPYVAIQLPITSVTPGCILDAFFFAHCSQPPQTPFDFQVRGMQLTLIRGITTQRSFFAIWTIGRIHICACESPITTIFFELFYAPRRQIFFGCVSLRPGVHSFGSS